MLLYSEKCLLYVTILLVSCLRIIVDFRFCNDLKSSGHVVTGSINRGYGFGSQSCFICFVLIMSTNFLWPNSKRTFQLIW
jgi:hypothetical protein